MNIVPIVFAFNYRVAMPAGVCFTSLLRSAKPDTFYDMFIIHGPGELNEEYQKQLTVLKETYPNCNFTFLDIGDAFNDVYIARGVPKLTYYRILIPELIKNYDKVIFSDVDIIFTNDLFEVYDTFNDDNYLAAVRSALVKRKYVESLGCNPDDYTNGGFQLYNLKQIRKDKMTPKLKELCGKKFFYLDQDITNIIYKGRVKFLSPRYNSTQTFFNKAHTPDTAFFKLFTQKEIEEGIDPYVIHYNGVNPWQGLCPRHDIWWAVYRSSIYFNEEFYYAHYHKILTPKAKDLINQLPKAILKKPFGKIYRKFFPY
jgi:UDP-glucose:(galactosyl)LPS alpha-1,2-glucosyltransferase